MKFTLKVVVSNQLGLHLRAAAQLTKLANRFKCQINIGNEGKRVNAKSLMGLMTLAAHKGAILEIVAEGDEASDAINALKGLFQNKFYEGG